MSVLYFILVKYKYDKKIRIIDVINAYLTGLNYQYIINIIILIILWNQKK